jgi:hypothetical protein
MKNTIHIDGATGTLTILEGAALTPREPEKVVISGSISAPKDYILVRGADRATDHVVFSRSKMFIRYQQNERDYFGASIEGKLLLNPNLAAFEINAQKLRAPKELASLLKINRTFFANKELNATIVSSLNAFTATVTAKLEQSQDTRGNSKRSIEKEVESNMPKGFVLSMPIFVGHAPLSFFVEICIDSTDAGVNCWLESPELADLILQNRDAIIDAELAAIREKCDMPFVEQL